MSVTVHLPNCVVNALNHSVIESIASFNQPGKLPAFSSKSMMKTVDSLIIAGAFSIKLLICCIIGGPTIEIAAQTAATIINKIVMILAAVWAAISIVGP